MASRKSSGGKKRTTTKKARKPSGPREPKRGNATPPPDNPQRRHEETDIDRLLLTYTPEEGVTAAAAPTDAIAPAAGARRRRRGAAAAAEAPQRTIMSELAALRVAAVETSREMPAADEGAPVAAPMAEAGDFNIGFTPAIAPMPGVSNWVQLGPAAIPKGQTYSPARVLVTGRVTSLEIDYTNPNILYVGAAQGGVWKSTNAGKNWFPTSDHQLSLAIGAIAIDPANPLILYAGTGEGNFSGDSYYGNGVLKTTNGGASWTMNATATFMGARFCRIAVTPGTPARIFGATTFGLYRSLDAGVNWAKMSGGGLPGGNCTDVVIDRVNPNNVYAAFYGQGIWRTTNANAAAPTWAKLTTGLPAAGFSRIALGISLTSPNVVYALMADGGGNLINGFYRSTNNGTNWAAIALPAGNIGGQGFYNINVFVDRFTPDIVYLSGISVWKAVRNTSTNIWTITNVGATIHPDNHAFAQHPTSQSIVYAGNDGGVYRSTNAGATWDDSINKDLCITQFEFIAQHPTSDAVVLGGTQDNGTEQFRNDAVFYHSDDGDGGFACIEQSPSPLNALSTYYGPSPKRSTQGGKFGTWNMVTAGLNGTGSLFYPPMVMDRQNSQNVAFGTRSLNVTTTQGTGGWTSIPIPGFGASLSALDFVNSNLIYAGANNGNVFVFRKVGLVWNVTAIHAAPLPVGAFVTDIAAVPGSPNTVVVTFGGFGIPHVWRGQVPAAGTAAWASISTGLPDIPVNALAMDPAAATVFYIATDVAVYRTTNSGATWTQFSQGLPNCAVFDLQLHGPTRLLRAATHGRGLWEKKLDVPSLPAADLYFRDHAMATGRIVPAPNGVPAAYEDPLQYVALGAPQYIWMSTDMKVDALAGAVPQYQFPIASVDYVVYEAKLQHRNAVRGQVNRVYVQLHNRGFANAPNVTVKLLWADASAGLPPLPPDFWTMFPANSANTTQWHPIGAAKVVPSLSNTLPAILEWDWTPPVTAASHSCLLVIMDSPSDPIPAVNKVFDIGTLISREKRAALKNLVVVNPTLAPVEWFTVDFNAAQAADATIRMTVTGDAVAFGVALPKTALPAAAMPGGRRRAVAAPGRGPKVDGLKPKKANAREAARFKEVLRDDAGKYDLNNVLFAEGKGASIAGLKLPKGGVRAAFTVEAPNAAQATLSIVQEENGQVVGGVTVVIGKEES